MTSIILPACSDDDNDNGSTGTDDKKTETTYNGTLVVNGGAYTNDTAKCEIILGKEKLTLNMYDVKFAAAMPMSINLTVPEIPYYTTDGKIVFSGDSIVPMMGVAPVPTYMFNNINGYIENQELNFNATIDGRGSFTFSGKE